MICFSLVFIQTKKDMKVLIILPVSISSNMDSKFNKFTITELNTDSWLILKQPFCFSSGIEQLTGDQREIGYTRKLSSFLTFESIKKFQNKI